MCDYGQKADPRDVRIRELELEVARQWLDNHAEHCGQTVPPLPHDGNCHWPMPEALARLAPGEVYLLLLQARGECVGFRLQASAG